MRYYDPFDVAVEPIASNTPKPSAGALLAAARGVTSPRKARIEAKAMRFEIARDADSWDFGADPMIWARSSYGKRDLSAARFDEARPFEIPYMPRAKRLISVVALLGALSAIGQLGAVGVV